MVSESLIVLKNRFKKFKRPDKHVIARLNSIFVNKHLSRSEVISSHKLSKKNFQF